MRGCYIKRQLASSASCLLRLVATPAVRNIIREGKSHQLEAVIQTGAEFGMQSMDKKLVSLIHNGTITYDEARNYAIDLDDEKPKKPT